MLNNKAQNTVSRMLSASHRRQIRDFLMLPVIAMSGNSCNTDSKNDGVVLIRNIEPADIYHVSSEEMRKYLL